MNLSLWTSHQCFSKGFDDSSQGEGHKWWLVYKWCTGDLKNKRFVGLSWIILWDHYLKNHWNLPMFPVNSKQNRAGSALPPTFLQMLQMHIKKYAAAVPAGPGFYEVLHMADQCQCHLGDALTSLCSRIVALCGQSSSPWLNPHTSIKAHLTYLGFRSSFQTFFNSSSWGC